MNWFCCSGVWIVAATAPRCLYVEQKSAAGCQCINLWLLLFDNKLRSILKVKAILIKKTVYWPLFHNLLYTICLIACFKAEPQVVYINKSRFSSIWFIKTVFMLPPYEGSMNMVPRQSWKNIGFKIRLLYFLKAGWMDYRNRISLIPFCLCLASFVSRTVHKSVRICFMPCSSPSLCTRGSKLHAAAARGGFKVWVFMVRVALKQHPVVCSAPKLHLLNWSAYWTGDIYRQKAYSRTSVNSCHLTMFSILSLLWTSSFYYCLCP